MNAIVFKNVSSTWQGKVGKSGKASFPTDEKSVARIRKVVAYLNKRLDKVIAVESGDEALLAYEVKRDGTENFVYRVVVQAAAVEAAPADAPEAEPEGEAQTSAE